METIVFFDTRVQDIDIVFLVEIESGYTKLKIFLPDDSESAIAFQDIATVSIDDHIWPEVLTPESRTFLLQYLKARMPDWHRINKSN